MKKRYVDLAIHHMLLDAADTSYYNGMEPIRLVNKRLFRQDEDVPVMDEMAADPTLIIGLLHNKI